MTSKRRIPRLGLAAAGAFAIGCSAPVLALATSNTGTQFQFLNEFGSAGTGQGQFSSNLTGVAALPDGNLASAIAAQP